MLPTRKNPMAALVIHADKLPGNVSYLTDAVITSLIPRARKARQTHIVVRMGGKDVSFRYLGETVAEVRVHELAGCGG